MLDSGGISGGFFCLAASWALDPELLGLLGTSGLGNPSQTSALCQAGPGLPPPQWPCLCPCQEFPLNPKALSLGELYGEYDLSTSEWTDGILSSVMRSACAGKWGPMEGLPSAPQAMPIQGTLEPCS